RSGRVAIGRNRRKAIILRIEVRVAGELHVAAGAVRLLRLLQPVANELLAVPIAFLDLEHRPEVVALDDGVALEAEVADAVARPFGHGDAQLNPARLPVLFVADRFHFRIADAGADVSLLAIER